jgi:hypothetical protein
MVTTSVVGNIFVVHDPAGELVTTVGGQTTLDWVQIHTLLRASAGDYYDFMSCYLDVGSGVVDLGDASSAIYQDATGIGRWVFDQRSSWGTTRLQQYAYFSFYSLTAVLHEFGHRWLGYVNYTDMPGGAPIDRLHQDWIWSAGGNTAHWGRWLDDQNSCMDYDQAEWIDNGNGTFNRIDRDPNIPNQDQWFGFSPLDQYLMGFLPPTQVSPFRIIRSPSPVLSELGPYGTATGPYTATAGVETVTIANIQNSRPSEPANFYGPRNPTYLNSQRIFHEAVVVITKNTSVSSAFITQTDTWRVATTRNFRAKTAGRAVVDSSLLRSNYTGLYSKDNAADTGAAASGSPFWDSPDIWVRNADDGGLADQPTIRGQSNWIYVRVRNSSAQPYANVLVNLYLGNFLDLVPGTQFLYPVDWNPNGLLGSELIPSVPAASGAIHGEAIAKLEWTSALIPPAVGWHPCLLSEVLPMETMPTGLHFVYENRKLAQRNITILDPTLLLKGSIGGKGGKGGLAGGGYYFAHEFWVGHQLRPAQKTRLRIRAERHLPEFVRLFLDPAGLIGDIAAGADRLELDIPLETLDAESPDETSPMIEVADGEETRNRGREQGRRTLIGPNGLTLIIPKGTDVGVEPTSDRPEGALSLRFENETRIRIGGRQQDDLGDRFQMQGLRPVVVNGLPLLEVTNPIDAGFILPLEPHQRHKLRLLGIVHGDARSEQSGLYHITEEIGGRPLGGVSVETRLTGQPSGDRAG